jgi:hypothetical protein
MADPSLLHVIKACRVAQPRVPSKLTQDMNYADSIHLCGLVIRVLGYRSRDPGSIPGATKFFSDIVDLERCPLGLVRIIEELFKETAAPV